MTTPKLLAFAAIACSAAAAAAHAVPPLSPKQGLAGAEAAPFVNAQYSYERHDGGDGRPAGPGWRGGLPGGWYGRPGWYGDPPGQPPHWPSQWGGGWYGGWYQPYWGRGAWESPNWTYGSPYYYGQYPAPSACGPNGCGEPAPDYAPLK